MKIWKSGITLTALFVSSLTFAQVRPPQTSNPLQNLPKVETPSKPSVKAEVHTENPNSQLEALLATKVKPPRFDVVGVHAIPFHEVADVFHPMLGKTVQISEILKATNTLNAVYKKHGYALSFGYLPNQTFAKGVVHITVVEGYVATVVIQGQPGNMEGRIRALANHLLQEKPLKQKTFERYLQLLGQLPGVKINANVPPPTTTDGATKLVLSVERSTWNVTTGLDFNHPGLQGLTSVTENGLTPLNEQVVVSTLFPNGPGHQTLYSLAYLQPLWSNGLMLRASASHYEGNPDTEHQLPTFLQERMKQDQVAFNLAYPIVLDNHHNLTVTGGVYATNFRDQYTNTLNGATLLQAYNLRVLDGKLNYLRVGEKSSQKIEVEIAHGLSSLGATGSVVTRFGNQGLIIPTDPSFTRYNVSVIETHDWPHQFGSVLSFAGQYSKDTLPTTEQISFGGPRFGLAYDPGSTSGDSGWGGALEFNRRFDMDHAWFKQITPYVLIQYARVYLNVGQPVLSKLGSAGLGVRWSDKKHYAFDLTLAKPFGDKPIGARSRDPRINFAFSYQLR